MNLYLIQTESGRFVTEAKNKTDLIHLLNVKKVNFSVFKKISYLHVKAGEIVQGFKLMQYVNSIEL